MSQLMSSERGEFLRQFNDGGMGEPRKHDMLNAIELVFDRRINAWIGVTKEIGPPRADAIHEDQALVIRKPSTLPFDHAQGGYLFMLLHLCARVPNTAE